MQTPTGGKLLIFFGVSGSGFSEGGDDDDDEENARNSIGDVTHSDTSSFRGS